MHFCSLQVTVKGSIDQCHSTWPPESVVGLIVIRFVIRGLILLLRSITFSSDLTCIYAPSCDWLMQVHSLV